MGTYTPTGPDNYPVAWHTLLKKCLDNPGDWVDVEAVQTASQGVNRMKRLRAFGKSFSEFPGVHPDTSARLAQMQIHFRKVPWEFRWFRYSVQMMVSQPSVDASVLEEILKN